MHGRAQVVAVPIFCLYLHTVPNKKYFAMSKVRVGAVQAEPGWVDLSASVEKTIALIKEAGEKGINVLGFPEVWIPGYLW